MSNELEKQEMKSEELKPCPFCGGEDTELAPGVDNDWYVGCLTCNYKIHCLDCTEDEVIRYWNTRPAEDTLKAENESLKEKVKSEKLTNISLGETITRASIEASRAKTECVRLKAEVEELRYIKEQFFSDWYCEDGCPKQKDKKFPCHGEEENETTAEFYPGECSFYQTKCWVEYYRWKYKQFCVAKDGESAKQADLCCKSAKESDGEDE